MILLPLLTALVVGAAPLPVAGSHAAAPASRTGIGLPRLPRIHLPKRSAKSSAAPLAAMDRRLRTLVSQEEAWWAQNSRYGNNVSKLAARGNVADASQNLVQVQVLYAGKRGWTAIASHPDAPGKSCVVYVGYREGLPLIPRTRADAKEAVDEGRPACDS